MSAKEDKLTAERLRELLTYDPETGLFIRRVNRPGKWGKAGTVAGHINAHGYRVIWIGANHMAHRLAWLYVHGAWPDGQLDHINQDKTDNRLENLRLVTHAENMQNRPHQRNNSTGLKGVLPRTKYGGWPALICANNKQIWLGTFDSPEAAHAAYCAAAARLHTHNPVANPVLSQDTPT
ncbi:HNH endonuclease [Pelomonas sp. V22]|uniref:HNH endonuclease n=1 Tax=Pelomonas sp. V22 TaxID=2822139 RepID=UPI0024A83228|nr:HNH endonuclease [Pelomonas sp. V22]MDI4633332.1 HNH endonuclease [Pelomonas sp. V22]